MAQTPRSVGTSMPGSGPPRRLPDEGLMVPTSFIRRALPLIVIASPAWQEPQRRRSKAALPVTPAGVSAPSALA